MSKIFKQVIITEEGNPKVTTGIVVYYTNLGKSRFHRHHQTLNEWWSNENPHEEQYGVDPEWYLVEVPILAFEAFCEKYIKYDIDEVGNPKGYMDAQVNYAFYKLGQG